MIDSSLIDVYVPFLPLERKHVKLCVEKEAGERNLTMSSEQVSKVVDSLTYWPQATKMTNLFVIYLVIWLTFDRNQIGIFRN